MSRGHSGTDIKKAIVAKRLERAAIEGFAFGHPVPETRQVPLVPFDRSPFVICEIKRKSPSRGDIVAGLDAEGQARRYVEAGVKTISVLTEEDHFAGSLADLLAVKKAFPETAFLRKDFLVRRQDIDVSFRSGADAVLLIASILEAEELRELKEYAEALGMAVFLEVHSQQDVDKTSALAPAFTGINSRDLTDFSIDRALPLKIRPLIDWPTRLVYESGIFRLAEAGFAAASGFQGVLVGEGAVKDPALAGILVRRFKTEEVSHPAQKLNFWARLYERQRPGRPLVKVCGLTRDADVRLADELGADLLGFILAPSQRRVGADFVRSLAATRALKVGVVVLEAGEDVPAEIQALVAEGRLDALQFQGRETPELVDAWGSRGYKAVAVKDGGEAEAYERALPPRVLLDAYAEGLAGGTGKRIAHDLLKNLSGRKLWLAGGLGPSNIRLAVETYRPELVDASSGLESTPGIKDPQKLKTYFAEIENARVQ